MARTGTFDATADPLGWYSVEGEPLGFFDVNEIPSPFSTIDPTNVNYYFSGHSIVGVGSFTHPLAAWPGAQIRVQSGATAGTTTISARSVRGPAFSTKN